MATATAVASTKPLTLTLRRQPSRLLTGTVILANHVPRLARVQHKHLTYDKYLRKHFPASTTYLVSDPRSSLRSGDVISFRSGFRTGATVRHVVERIVAPFGTGVDERPPVMSREEREEWVRGRREAKRERRGKGREVQVGKITGRVVGRLRRMEEERGGKGVGRFGERWDRVLDGVLGSEVERETLREAEVEVVEESMSRRSDKMGSKTEEVGEDTQIQGTVKKLEGMRF